MRYSARFSYVLVLFTLLLAQSLEGKAQQSEEAAIAAARELANTSSKTTRIFIERLFGAAFAQMRKPDETASLVQAFEALIDKTYVEVATPIFSRRMSIEDMQRLTDEFKTPVFQTFTDALAEGSAMVVPCMFSELGALPKSQEPPSEEQHRLARQLWALQNQANAKPPNAAGEPAFASLEKKLQEVMEKLQEEMSKRSACIDDGAAAVLARRLTAEELRTMIALERTQPMQKLNLVLEEVAQQMGQRVAEDMPKIFRAR